MGKELYMLISSRVTCLYVADDIENIFSFFLMHAADTCFHSSPPTSTSVSQTLARHSSFIHFIHLQMVSA